MANCYTCGKEMFSDDRHFTSSEIEDFIRAHYATHRERDD